MDGELIDFASMKDNDILFAPIELRLFGRAYREVLIKYLLENFDCRA